METGIEKLNSALMLDRTFKQRLVEFNEAMATNPPEKELKQHPHLTISKTLPDGTKVEEPYQYIPIEITESKLNHYFFGLWETFDFKYQVVVNEIVGDLTLNIFHPEAGIWLRRVGTGGVVIQQKAKYEDDGFGGRKKVEQDLMDINRKIANTLVKDMGHLKSECIKNAAKSLGATFGANMGRDIEDVGYQDFMLTPEAVAEEIANCQDQHELNLYFETLPLICRSDKRIRTILLNKQLEFKKGGNDATV